MVRAAAAVSVGALVVSPLAIATTATAAVDGSGLVISEVYGGGGNSGAVHTHDFVELHNPTDTAIDLSNLTLQYPSAANTNAAGRVAPLSGTVSPGDHFVVPLASQARPERTRVGRECVITCKSRG